MKALYFPIKILPENKVSLYFTHLLIKPENKVEKDLKQSFKNLIQSFNKTRVDSSQSERNKLHTRKVQIAYESKCS